MSVEDAEVAAKAISESLKRARQLLLEANGAIRNAPYIAASPEHSPEITLPSPDQSGHSTQAPG